MKIIRMLILLAVSLNLILASALYAVSLSEIDTVKKSISARYRMLVETTPQYTKDTKTLLWLRTTAPKRLKAYDGFFNAALISHGYAKRSLDLASDLLGRGDVEGAKKFIEKSSEYQREMDNHVKSANLALQQGWTGHYHNIDWIRIYTQPLR